MLKIVLGIGDLIRLCQMVCTGGFLGVGGGIHIPTCAGKLNDPAYLMARLNAANVEDSIEDNAPLVPRVMISFSSGQLDSYVFCSIAYSQPEIFVGAVDSFNERPIPSFSQPAFRGHDEDMAMTQPTQSMGSLSQAQARITADRLMRFFRFVVLLFHGAFGRDLGGRVLLNVFSLWLQPAHGN